MKRENARLIAGCTTVLCSLALLCILLYRKQHFLLGTKSSGVISIYEDRHFLYLPTGDNETSNVKVNPLK